jgi:hypothetical protein
MSVMQGICPQCGTVYYGWALEDPLKRTCSKCGSTVEIIEEDLADRLYDISLMSPEHRVKRTRDLEITLGD